MVQAGTLAVEVVGEPARPQRLDQLQVDVARVQVHQPRARSVEPFVRDRRQPEPAAEFAARRVGVRDQHGHVIDTAQHGPGQAGDGGQARRVRPGTGTDTAPSPGPLSGLTPAPMPSAVIRSTLSVSSARTRNQPCRVSTSKCRKP